jgi:CubicO group peptidase (beta-lactamase class C family)
MSTTLQEHFGEQGFVPKGGFVLRQGQQLPDLVWEDPAFSTAWVDDLTILTRWFNDRFEAVTSADRPGRYYVYGEAQAPEGPTLRRAMTCCCVEPDQDLARLAVTWHGTPHDEAAVEQTVKDWQTSEAGALRLAALLEPARAAGTLRPGEQQMENASAHVRLKRKLMGLDGTPAVQVTARPVQGGPAPVLREGTFEQAEISEAIHQDLDQQFDQWYAAAGAPNAVVIARHGVIVLAKGYGEIDGHPVTVDTPMLLHSAMKPLLGIQLAMYADRGIVQLDEPIGNVLPDFSAPKDRELTFRAGHVHVSGIHFPWELAFSRLFYFDTWQDSLIAHRGRDWAPGARHRYGIVGIILAVRALELLTGKNYWEAMETQVFEPLGIKNVLPGGTGFSAENLARIGVLLDNHGTYGDWELFTEQTYQSILPATLKPYFPDVSIKYGIGLQDNEVRLGASTYGHGGGCGTLLLVNPEKHLVVAIVRNERGDNYDAHLADTLAFLNAWIH